MHSLAPSTQFAPAKLNLFLAITGRRADGFHELVSVVAPLTFGDRLTVAPAAGEGFELRCNDPELACDETNLVLKAARAFAQATGWRGGASFQLDKRVPLGAGLGGGSSDAVAALRGLNELAGGLLSGPKLAALSAELGSDCPLFLAGGPVVMRGRGERIAPLPAAAAARLSGRRVLLFKPAFGIATAWAYRRLAEKAASADLAADGSLTEARRSPARPYLSVDDAEARLSAWVADPAGPVEALLFNSLELPAFEKHLALPTLLARLREEFGLEPRMTGSGSACFAFLPEESSIDPIAAIIRTSWGDSAFVTEARLV